MNDNFELPEGGDDNRLLPAAALPVGPEKEGPEEGIAGSKDCDIGDGGIGEELSNDVSIEGDKDGSTTGSCVGWDVSINGANEGSGLSTGMGLVGSCVGPTVGSSVKDEDSSDS